MNCRRKPNGKKYAEREIQRCNFFRYAFKHEDRIAKYCQFGPDLPELAPSAKWGGMNGEPDITAEDYDSRYEIELRHDAGVVREVNGNRPTWMEVQIEQMQAEQVKCGECGGKGGYTWKHKKFKCRRCNGSGMVNPAFPHGTDVFS